MKDKVISDFLNNTESSIKEFESNLNKVGCEDLNVYDATKIRLRVIERLENVLETYRGKGVNDAL